MLVGYNDEMRRCEETEMRPWGGGLEVFAKSKNISNMDMVLIILYPHSLKIYLGLSSFTFHIIHYYFRFSLNPNPNISKLILWVEGAKYSCLFLCISHG